MTSVPDEWQEYTLLGSGSHEFLRLIMPKLRHHVGPFIFANDMAFTGRRCSKVNRLHRSWAAHDYRMGLESTTVRHADFGGITSAVHGISFRGVDISIFTPSAPLPRTLHHVLLDTTPDATQEISAPTPLTDPQPRVPVYIDGMMRRKGLFDIGKPTAPIACPCVFKPTGWGCRRLSAKELLRAFDVSPLDNAVLLTHRRAQTLLQRSITPLVVTTICRNLWNTGGGNGGAGTKQDEVLPSNDKGMARRTSYKKGDSGRKDNNKEQNKDKKNIGEKHKEEDVKDEEDTEVEEEKLTQDQELLRAIKKAHNLAKAVKSDDAEVPKHLWDAAVCRGPSSPNQARALAVLRVFMLRIYRKRLWREIRAYMQHTHRPDWITKMRDTMMQRNLVEVVEGMRDILWRATENEWFQCPVGSRLLFFRFPPHHRKQELIQVRQEENCTTGPVFGYEDRPVALMREYDEVLQSFLSVIQQEDNDLIAATDDVQALYGLSRTFRRTAEGRARAANLESHVQNAMNRWRKIEQAKGKCPRFNMVDHYAHARDLMHVTWRYSFVQ